MGKVARFLDCSLGTVRNLCASGQLDFVLTLGGHRKIAVKSVQRFAYGLTGDEDGSSHAARNVVIYARVSTEKQNSAGSLQRQIERLRGEVSIRENLPAKEIPVYSDVASSFGSRDSLNKLADDIIDGKVKRIYCEYLDRLSRVPGLTHLLNHLCERYAVEVVALDLEDSEEQEIYQKELLGFLTVWCNRQSSMKAKRVVEKTVDEKCLNRMMELRVKGLQIKQIVEQIQKEGWTTVKPAGRLFHGGDHDMPRLLDQLAGRFHERGLPQRPTIRFE